MDLNWIELNRIFPRPYKFQQLIVTIYYTLYIRYLTDSSTHCCCICNAGQDSSTITLDIFIYQVCLPGVKTYRGVGLS